MGSKDIVKRIVKRVGAMCVRMPSLQKCKFLQEKILRGRGEGGFAMAQSGREEW